MKVGYKKTKVGVIPKEWEVSRLGGVISKITGGGTPSKEKKEYWEREIPWATVKDLKSFRLVDTIDYISFEGLENSASNLIPANTIIISTRMALGKAVFYNKDVAINQDLKAIFPKNEIDKEFLFYWFQANSVKIEKLGFGSTVKGIRLETLKTLKIAYPNIPEQKKIASILTATDEKIEAIQTRIEQTEQLKKGLMQRLLTKGIRHSEFKDSKLGKIPKSWEVVNSNSLSEITSSKRIHRSEYVEKGIPFFRSKEIILKSKGIKLDKSNIIKIQKSRFESLKKKFGAPEEGDILITAVGTIGITYLVKPGEIFYFKDGNLMWLKNFKREISRQYLNYYFSSSLFQNLIENITGGSSQKALTIEKFKTLLVLIPSIKEQNKIAEILATADEKIDILNQKKSTYEQLKKGLMQKLLTGAIRVKI